MQENEQNKKEKKSYFKSFSKKYDLSKLLNYVSDGLSALEDEREPKEVKWRELLNGYKCKVSSDPEKDKNYVNYNKLSLPIIFDAVEENHAQIINSVFPQHDNFADIRCAAELKPAAEVILKYIHSRVRKDCMTEIEKTLKNMGMLGTSVMHMYPDKKYKSVNYMDIASGKIKTKDVVEFDGIKCEALSNFHWYFDTNKNFGDGLFIRKYWEDMEHLRRLEKEGYFFNIDELSDTNYSDDEMEQHRQESKYQSDMQYQENSFNKISKHLLYEVWGDIPVWDNSEMKYVWLNNHRIIIADNKVVISIDENPHMDGSIPFIPGFYMPSPDPEDKYGQSIIVNALDIFHAANKFFNAVIDLADIQIKVPRKGLSKDRAFWNWVESQGGKIEPGTVIPVDFLNDLPPLEYPAYLQNVTFQTVGELIDKFQEATKSIKNFSHRNYKKSATEIAGILQQISSFMAKTVIWIQRSFIVPFVQKYYNMFLQYQVSGNIEKILEEMSEELDMDIVGHLAGFNLPPESLFIDWNFVSAGNNYFAIREARLQKLIMFTREITQIPGAVERFKIKELIYGLAREFDIKGYDEFIMDDVEWEQKLKEMAEQARQQQEQQLNADIAKKNPGMVMLQKAMEQGAGNGQENDLPPEGLV